MGAFRCVAKVLIGLTTLACASAAELKTLLDPNDLPPHPSDGSSTVLTQSQKERGAKVGGANNNSQRAGANAEERALAKEIEDLEKQVAEAEAKAYREDSDLLLSDLYQERAHEWVMSKHNDEFNASLMFAKNPRTKKEQDRLNKMVDLIDMILFVELANDPKFRPLFVSFCDAIDSRGKTNRAGAQGFYNYDRNDKVIGYAPESALASVSSLNEYLKELNRRYPLLLSKLEELKTEAAIPADAFAGLTFGELYRLLDGMAQNAVLLRTPEELKELRQKLRTKGIQLANLRAK